MTAVLRHTVPVDDHWHYRSFAGDIVHVATRQVDAVEFWTLASPGQADEVRYFRVFGAGHPIPDGPVVCHRGTAFAAGGQLVWHLIEGWPPVGSLMALEAKP
jgi:hypothetical protein